MMEVCPVIKRAWWKIKLSLWPWLDQSKAPEPRPRMREADDMLTTAIFDLSQLLDQHRQK